jgi:hypothetical protein
VPPFGFGSGSQGLASTEACAELAVVQHLNVVAVEALAHTQRIDDPDQVVAAEPVRLRTDLAWTSGRLSVGSAAARVKSLCWPHSRRSVAVGRDVAPEAASAQMTKMSKEITGSAHNEPPTRGQTSPSWRC